MAPEKRTLKDVQLENNNLRNVLKHHIAETTRITKELREAQASVDRLRKSLNAALIREDELKTKMEEDESKLPNVLTSDVYMCSICAYEVVDGYCQGEGCGIQHAWPPVDPLHDNRSISTDACAIHHDHSPVRRGDVPARDINQQDSQPPEEYRRSRSRRLEYIELLRRGATRLMCETFHLEYTDDEGIHAWADWEIYRDFAVPHMQIGDFWKIHLGRRIELDEEDLDGSMFIEDLLEAALMFPALSRTCNRTYEKWETIEESPGIWLTRLVDREEDVSDVPDYDDDLSEDESSDDECLSYVSASDGGMQLENKSGPGTHILNVYSSGDDMDSEDDELCDDDDEVASHDSISDSDDGEVYDTAFVGFTGPDGEWASDMDDSEDGA